MATQPASPAPSYIAKWATFQSDMEASKCLNHPSTSKLFNNLAINELSSIISTNLANNTNPSSNSVNNK